LSEDVVIVDTATLATKTPHTLVLAISTSRILQELAMKNKGVLDSRPRDSLRQSLPGVGGSAYLVSYLVEVAAAIEFQAHVEFKSL
jgi:hypothetical protein